jgi:hypothetical protein
VSDECPELLKRAERLWKDGTHDKRAQAVELARNVEQRCRGTLWAETARTRLQEWVIIREPYQNDLELDAYTLKWQAVQSLFDGQLATVFEEIKRNPSIAARMRRTIIKDLRRWIDDATTTINNGLNPNGLDAIHHSLNAITTMDTYTVDLADELNRLQRARFMVAHEQITPEIRKALEEWQIDAAMNLWKQLCALASEFQAEVAALQKEILRVDKLRQAVQDFLSRPAEDEPRDWLQLRRLIDSLARLLEFLDETPIPALWHGRLRQQADRCIASAQAFFRKQTAAAGTLTQIRDFWTEYESMDFPALGAQLAPQEEWFSACLEQVIRMVSKEVAEAKAPDELKEWASKLEENKKGLPNIVSDRVDALAKDVERMAVNWESMMSGNDFDALAANTGRPPAPKKFQAAAAKYQTLLAKIAEGFERIESGPSSSDYLEIAQMAQDILSEVPNHQRAGELKRAAEQGILRLELEEALCNWQIEKFLALCRSGKVEKIYADIATYQEGLYKLASLAEQKQFSLSSKAAEWWSQWRALRAALPPSLPKSLEQAIVIQERVHRDLWYSLLEVMRDPEQTPNLEPEECRAIANSLKNEPVELSLEEYEIDFNHRATVGFIDRYIADGNYQRAEEEINNLKRHQPDTVRLQTRLKIGQARIAGARAVIDVFSKEWSNVIAHLDNPYDLLMEVIQEAWDMDAPELLEALKTLIDYALLSGEPASPSLERLRQWGEWLRVEFDLRFNFSSRSVEQLADYIKAADPQEPGFHKRLERLIDYWEKQNTPDTVMLAWAYQAFRHLDETLMPRARDPREDMDDSHEQAARMVIRRLETTADLTRPDLEAMLRDLDNEQRKGKELEYYFRFLNFQPNRRQVPPLFTKTKRQLESLIEKVRRLEHLEDSDLRQEAERVENIERSLGNEFKDYALQPLLLQRVERLIPLTRMNYLLRELETAAAECDDDDNVNDLKCFPLAKELLDKIIQIFTDAQGLNGKMWRAVSEDYCNLVYAKAAIFLPKPLPADLRALADRIAVVMKQEQELKSAIDVLWKERPPIPVNGSFKREYYREYIEYLKLLPHEPPAARKIEERFRRFAVDQLPTILQQCRADLPEWVCKYLDERVA